MYDSLDFSFHSYRETRSGKFSETFPLGYNFCSNCNIFFVSVISVIGIGSMFFKLVHSLLTSCKCLYLICEVHFVIHFNVVCVLFCVSLWCKKTQLRYKYNIYGTRCHKTTLFVPDTILRITLICQSQNTAQELLRDKQAELWKLHTHTHTHVSIIICVFAWQAGSNKTEHLHRKALSAMSPEALHLPQKSVFMSHIDKFQPLVRATRLGGVQSGVPCHSPRGGCTHDCCTLRKKSILDVAP